jgi:uncharacterized protein (DUF1800 family)
VKRRDFLALGALSGALLTTGCETLSALHQALRANSIPKQFSVADSTLIDPDFHFLSRVTFGPRPGDLDRVRRIGREAFLEQQLDPKLDEGLPSLLKVSAIDVMHLDAATLYELPPEQIERQLIHHAVTSALLSERQLHEVLVEAFSDHFHVAVAKGDCRHLLPADRRDVVRQHVLGPFRDLLAASVLSPAMLVYLDGAQNSAEHGAVPNENHARELLELHTLGVDGGYTQQDVKEVARCLTGYVVGSKWNPGAVEFVAARHDDGEKRVLGHTLPAGGGRLDLDRLLDLLVNHPSTARNVARRLAKTFISDDPPRELIEGAANTFLATEGDLRAVTQRLLLDEGFPLYAGKKVKRPFRFVVSALRALGVTALAEGSVSHYLERMGHKPFGWPTPDGYPQSGLAYLPSLLPRFQFGRALAEGSLEAVEPDLKALYSGCAAAGATSVLAHLFGRSPSKLEEETLLGPASPPSMVAMALSSPAFQRC